MDIISVSRFLATAPIDTLVLLYSCRTANNDKLRLLFCMRRWNINSFRPSFSPTLRDIIQRCLKFIGYFTSSTASCLFFHDSYFSAWFKLKNIHNCDLHPQAGCQLRTRSLSTSLILSCTLFQVFCITF